jgi:hypothetical protein
MYDSELEPIRQTGTGSVGPAPAQSDRTGLKFRPAGLRPVEKREKVVIFSHF